MDVTKQEVVKSTYDGIRGLDPDVAKIYGIQLQLDADDNPVRYAFKHKTNIKYRGYEEKKFWVKERGVPMEDLFGPPFNAGTSKRLYLTEGECFLPDTEVLTPEGWKALEDLGSRDRVMQVNTLGYGSFTYPYALVDKQYEGDLIEYKSGSYYSITTEGHSLVRLDKDSNYMRYPATTHKHLSVPRVLKGLPPVKCDNTPVRDTLKYLVWIMLSADFTFRKKGDIYGAFLKTRKIERVKFLLDQLAVRYHTAVSETSGYTSFFIHRGHDLDWASKKLPWEMVYRDDRQELLAEVVFWDGNLVKGRNQAEFATKDKDNADVVQALAHTCGYTSTIMLRENQFGSWYKVSILYGKTTSSTQAGFKRVPYQGRVMCVTVPTGMVLVRQKGSISVSGNCDAASLYQVLGKTYPVLSLPSASIGEKFIKKNYEYLNSFQEIVYAGELDEAGCKAAERLYAVLPTKFWYVPLTKWKDANEFLMNGDGEALKWAALKPQRYAPDNFFCTDADVEKAIREENPYEYVPTGHAGWDEKMRGLVKGGITFIKAPRGTGKCLAPNQKVLMFDGSVKEARYVVEGDQLLGPDSTPRNVLSTVTGREEMFAVVPVKGEAWVCNKSHILALYNYEKGYTNISVEEFLKLPNNKKPRFVQYRAETVEFEGSYLPYDPYFVGMYLGDGSKHSSCITLGDTKSNLVDYLYSYTATLGWTISVERMKGCNGYHFVTDTRGKVSPFRELKSKLFFEGVRCIPQEYKVADSEHRRRLLAGLLDTDGSISCGGFEITQKSKTLAEDICFVARSLGKAAYLKEKVVTGKTYYRVNISGDFMDIPFLRHKVQPRKQIKNVLRTGFTLKSLGEGDYCGFELDGDKLFVLGDFTVTHNTELIRYFETAMLKSEDCRIALLHAEEMRSTTYRAMATYELGVNVRTKDDAKWNNITEEQVIEAAKLATKGERTIIFEMRIHDDPMKILEYIRLAASVYGAGFIFVDHVQRLAYLSQTGVDGATAMLTALGSRAAQLAKELNIGVIFISQVNDDGRTKYAAALEEEAIICVKLDRDIDSDDEILQNTTRFVIDKNRPFSKLGDAGAVYYDAETTLLSEVV